MSASPLRLAFDATACIGTPTGVGQFAHELLARAGASAHLDVTAFAVSWRGRDVLGERCPPGVSVTRRPMAARPLREAWKRANQPPIELWTGPIDVVHGPNFVVPPARLAAEVVTVHDLTPVRHPELCTSDTLAYPALIARAIDRGAWVHTPSRYVAAEVIEHFGAPPERVVPIHNGVTASPVDAAGASDAVDKAAEEGRRLVGHDEYILALGTIEPRKDLPALVEAFDLLADDHPRLALAVVGPDGWGVDAFESALRASVHRARVVRMGWVDADERAALLSGATALAYPSRYEGFGLPPLEAMAAGVPVVATDAGALPEVLGDAAELVSAETIVRDRRRGIRELADAIGAVLDEPATRRAARIEAGRKRASIYSWDRTFDEMLGLYRRADAERTTRG